MTSLTRTGKNEAITIIMVQRKAIRLSKERLSISLKRNTQLNWCACVDISRSEPEPGLLPCIDGKYARHVDAHSINIGGCGDVQRFPVRIAEGEISRSFRHPNGAEMLPLR